MDTDSIGGGTSEPRSAEPGDNPTEAIRTPLSFTAAWVGDVTNV